MQMMLTFFQAIEKEVRFIYAAREEENHDMKGVLGVDSER